MAHVHVSTPVVAHRSDGRGLDVIEEPDVRRLADYWSMRRQGRRMPSHADIDPIDIPWALSRIYLLDYVADEQTFRYRLAGGDIEDMFRPYTNGSGLRGKTFGDFLPAHVAAEVQGRWMPMITEEAVLYMSGQIYKAESRRAVGARIILPLGDDVDSTITGAVGFTQCAWELDDNAQAPPPLNTWIIPIDEIA